MRINQRTIVSIARAIAHAAGAGGARSVVVALGLIVALGGCARTHSVAPSSSMGPPAVAADAGPTPTTPSRTPTLPRDAGPLVRDAAPSPADATAVVEDAAPPPPQPPPTPTGVDQDMDGYTNDVDCNDMDPTVHPGAPEWECGTDGIDSNCDGWDFDEECELNPECIEWVCNG